MANTINAKSFSQVNLTLNGQAYQMLKKEHDELIGLIKEKRIDEAINWW